MRQLRQIGVDLGRKGAVRELLAALQDQGPAAISTFEFLSSGAVKQLRAYLQGLSFSLLPWVSVQRSEGYLKQQVKRPSTSFL